MIQPDTPRGRWPLGPIAEVYPGRDGHTRVAKVACGVKTVLRPINKLIPLGIDCQSFISKHTRTTSQCGEGENVKKKVPD